LAISEFLEKGCENFLTITPFVFLDEGAKNKDERQKCLFSQLNGSWVYGCIAFGNK
jgi:hypothetical protein